MDGRLRVVARGLRKPKAPSPGWICPGSATEDRHFHVESSNFFNKLVYVSSFISRKLSRLSWNWLTSRVQRSRLLSQSQNFLFTRMMEYQPQDHRDEGVDTLIDPSFEGDQSSIAAVPIDRLQARNEGGAWSGPSATKSTGHLNYMKVSLQASPRKGNPQRLICFCAKGSNSKGACVLSLKS